MTPGPLARRRLGSGGGRGELLWYPPLAAAELARIPPCEPSDAAVLSGESRVEVRVRQGRVALRAYELGGGGASLPIAMLVEAGNLNIVAPESSAVAAELIRAEGEAESAEQAFWLAWDLIVAGYQSESESTVAAAEEVAQRVLVGPQRGLGHITYRVRRRAFALRQAVQRAQVIFTVLAEELPQEWGPGAARRCREIGQRIQSAYNDVEAVRESLGETVEAYTSVQSNEMTHVMQVMTIVSLLFLPPTLIASIYGMNFRIPEYAWPQGYAWSLGLMVALTGLTLLWAARRRWLR